MVVIKDGLGLIFVPRITGASALDVLRLFSFLSALYAGQAGYPDNKIVTGCLHVNETKKRKLHGIRCIDSELCGLLAVSGES